MNQELKGIAYLRRKLALKKTRVNLRYEYYEMKRHVIEPGLTIPPALRGQYQATLGWCAKAVDSLADRLVFREFSDDNFDLGGIFNMNNPDVFFDSTILSALIGSCCFIYISPDNNGFPRLQVVDGGNATGVIDPITGLLTEGYAVLSQDENKNPTVEAYFAPGWTEYIRKGEREIERVENNVEYPLLVPIIYRSDAMRPFGHSRISRSCMYFQRYASRTLERSDVSAEFYSVPQRYVTGMSQSAEPMDKWKATVSSMMQFSKDEDGNSPSLGQFAQQSMSPFTEQLRTAAAGFAGETGLTLDDLGFATENPSSAEAIKAAHENLRAAARKAQRCFGSGFLNVGFLAACMRDHFAYKRQQLYLTTPKWEPVFEPDAATLSSIGDGAIKINQAIPGYFGSENLRDLTGITGSEEKT